MAMKKDSYYYPAIFTFLNRVRETYLATPVQLQNSVIFFMMPFKITKTHETANV